MQNHIIDAFIDSWYAIEDHYEKTAKACQDLCRDVLEQSGIKHIATFRTKRSDRLREKLYQRNQERNYASAEQIVDDIHDLAGVRIALYFPGDRPKATELISDQFRVVKSRDFPGNASKRKGGGYEYRFQGYSATHLHVFLKPDLNPTDPHRKQLTKAKVEIQIASVLMHAWSEVEHDLIYKPQSGELSVTEYSLLDQVNGLVCTGEIALEQLQRTMVERLGAQLRPFASHYDLASFIYASSDVSHRASVDARMGRADLLFAYLGKLGMLQPTDLKRLMARSGKGGKTLVDQIVSTIVAEVSDESSQRSALWDAIVADDAAQRLFDDPDAAATQFSLDARKLHQRWRSFEALALRAANEGEAAGRGRIGFIDQEVLERLGFEAKQARDLVAAQKMYMSLAADNWHNTLEDLRLANPVLEQAIQQLALKYPKLLDPKRDAQ
jgi:ppGpp synthetase/RelA/SpoT-type nucleotidyltranferase